MSKTDKPSSAPASSKKPDAARRALLRGVAVGIPSVVTLASGSAWGAAGSVPCFNAVYAGRFETITTGPDSGRYKFTQAVGTAQPGDFVTTSNTSQFCWNSGGPIPWNQLR